MHTRTRARSRARRLFRQASSALRAMPFGLQLLLAAAALVALWFAANGVYQVARKPSELLFP